MCVPFYPFDCAWTNLYYRHVPRVRQWVLIFSIQKSDTYPAKQDSNPYKNLHKSRILGSIDLQFLRTAATMLRYKYGSKFRYISEVGMWVFRDIQLSPNRLN